MSQNLDLGSRYFFNSLTLMTHLAYRVFSEPTSQLSNLPINTIHYEIDLGVAIQIYSNLEKNKNIFNSHFFTRERCLRFVIHALFYDMKNCFWR